MAKAKSEEMNETEAAEKVKKAPAAKKTTAKKSAGKSETKSAGAKKAQTKAKASKAGKAEKDVAVEAKANSEKKSSKKSTSIAEDELTNKSKQEIIEIFAVKTGDTGSPEVQIALSTQKIYNLSSHLKENPKDNHSRRGLLKIIAKRRRILSYLQDKDKTRYNDLIGQLGLKK